MKRVLLAAVFGSAVYAIALASAATLNVGQSSLGSGSNLASSCDSDGVTVAYGTTYTSASAGYTVTSVTISGVASGCEAKTVGATLTNAANAAQGTVTSGAVPAGGGSVTLAVSGNPVATAVEKAFVVIG
ncbi:MAG: hypothetical protein ACRDZ3_20300 [Acidimicrobiia bacterium]